MLIFVWISQKHECAPRHIPSHVIRDYHMHIYTQICLLYEYAPHVRCIQHVVPNVNVDMLRSEYIKPCWRYIA